LIRCAWCLKDLGEKEPLENPEISHGQCVECKRKMLLEAEKFFKEFFAKEVGK